MKHYNSELIYGSVSALISPRAEWRIVGVRPAQKQRHTMIGGEKKANGAELSKITPYTGQMQIC